MSKPPQRYRVQQDRGEYALKECADGDLVDYSAYAALLREVQQSIGGTDVPKVPAESGT